jgi:site-specific recombinase XerD
MMPVTLIHTRVAGARARLDNSLYPAFAVMARPGRGLVRAMAGALDEGSQTDTDEHLVAMWLHGRSLHTQRAYRTDAAQFMAFVSKPLRAIALRDVQAFADELENLDLAPSSRARKLAAAKSLLVFGHQLGYLPYDVGSVVRLPAVKDTLAERILPEADVYRLLALERNPRNHALLRLLYLGGLRVSEIAGLAWRDLQPRDEAGQMTIFGKGSKTRVVLLPAGIWGELLALRRGADPNTPVFRSRNGGHLHPTSIERLLWKAAGRAGLEARVSPHWLRHAHATHALERGAPIHLVQATLGHASVATTGRYLHARPTDSSARYLGG